MILLGNEFWKAYNGLNTAKLNGANYDVLSNLIDTCSSVFQNKMKNEGIMMSEEELESKINSFEALIPGATGRNHDKYFDIKHSGLKESAARAVQGNTVVGLEVEHRKPASITKRI